MAVTWNWNPSRVVIMDMETQSAVNLKSIGARAYLRHSTTRLLSAVFQIDGKLHAWAIKSRVPKFYDPRVPDCTVHVQEDCPEIVRQEIASGATFVAHNAEQFDSIAWERFVPGQQPSWYDTQPCCRAAGIPASIDKLGEFLLGKGKENKEAGQLLFTAKQRGGKIVYPVGTPALWDMFLRYNIQDVIILAAAFDYTRDFGESDVLAAHSAINAKGIPVDLKLAAVIRDLWIQFQKQAKDEVAELTGGELNEDNIRSIPKMKAWLRKQGLDIPSLERKQLEALIEDPDGFFGDTDSPAVAKVLSVILARQHACRATVGKVTRVFTAADDDGRIRGVHVAYGAGTGRFSSKEFQCHNMARGMARLDVEKLIRQYHKTGTITLADITAEAEKAKEAWQLGDPTGDALVTLMRPIIRNPDGKFVILDFARVEAVCVAWLSNAENALAIYRDPAKCIYCEQASAVYGRTITKANKDERGLGKIMILGLGYGMGANRFAVACKYNKPSVDLAAIGVTAEQCVKTFRETFADVPATWRAYERACYLALEGHVVRQNKCTFAKDGRFMLIALPSGREMRYRNARVEKRVPRWGGPPRDTLLYDGQVPGKELYGGKIMENIAQGTCRDLLASVLVSLPGACLHVHDEIVFESGDLREIARVMSAPPEWAQGFPLRVEGFTCEHYTKGGWSDSETVDAMNGEILHYKGKP